MIIIFKRQHFFILELIFNKTYKTDTEIDMIQGFIAYQESMIQKMIPDFLIQGIKIHEIFQSTKTIVTEYHKIVMTQSIAIMKGNKTNKFWILL